MKKARKPTREAVSRRIRRLRHLQGGSAAAMQVFATLDNGDPNPFDLVTPTKNNFAGIPEAIEYYQARRDVCTKATELLDQAAVLCTKVCAATERAAASFSKLTAADLGGLEVPPELRPPALKQWRNTVSPMAETFAEAASAYATQGELLDRTIQALRRGLLEVVK